MTKSKPQKAGKPPYSESELRLAAKSWLGLNDVVNELSEKQLWQLLQWELEYKTLRKKAIIRIFTRIRSLETKLIRERLEQAIEANDHKKVKVLLEEDM